MREYLLQHRSHHYPSLIRRWRLAARRHNLVFSRFAQQDGYWLYVLRSKRAKGRPAVYLSAGTHGDEPGSTEGLLHWAESAGAAEELAQVDMTIFPCLNPWGLVNNTRLMKGGQDLNRSFHDETLPIVAAWRSAITGRRYDVALHLHEDYDAQGLYLYELIPRRDAPWAEDLVREGGSGVVPVDPRASIDGRRTRQGVIRRIALPKRLYATMPESVYLYLNHTRRTYTVETPSEYSLHDRAQTHALVISAAIGKVIQE